MSEEDRLSDMLLPGNGTTSGLGMGTSQGLNDTHFYQGENLDLLDPFGFYTGLYEDYDYPEWELPKSSQIALITIYSITSVLAIGGNIIAILVLTLASQSKTDLNKYLVNLAVADLFMACFCIPFTFTQAMLGRWLLGQIMCPVVLFMQVTTVAVSIFTNTAIGVDRFVAVRYPLQQRITKTWTRFVILAIWMASALLAVVMLVFGRSTNRIYDGEEYWECGEYWPTEIQRKVYTIVLTIFTYVVPLSILSFTYYKIGVTLWHRRTPGNADFVRDQVQINSKRKVTKMLVILVAVFAACWLPIHVFNLVIDLAPQVLQIPTVEHQRIFLGVYLACHWLAMANSFANPLIYCFFNDNFRVDLKYLVTWVGYRCFYRCCHKRFHPHRTSVYFQEPFISRAIQKEQMDEMNTLQQVAQENDNSKVNTELSEQMTESKATLANNNRSSLSSTKSAQKKKDYNCVVRSER